MESELARAADIKLKYGVGNTKRLKRKYIALSGRIPLNMRYVVHNNNLINVYRALVERVFYVERSINGVKALRKPPTTNVAYFCEQMQEFKTRLVDLLPRSGRRMSLTEFVMTSPLHKRKVYENALKEYLTKGLAPSKSQVTSFIKAEKVRITPAKPDPAPRIIQPRSPEFNLIFGCFIRPIEKLIYEAIDRLFGRKTVVCGQNAEQQAEMLRGAWDEIAVRGGKPVALSLDLSRMDQHVSKPALKWEHSIYRSLFRNHPLYQTLDWCLQQTINNVGRCYVNDGSGRPAKVSYKKVGSRMSGDMNTSLGNKLIMCGLLYSYFVGVCGMEPRKDVNVVDNGDDCVVILSEIAYERYHVLTGQREQPKQHLKVDEWFETMGFTLKVEGIVDTFEHIEFCQTQPCFIDGRWVMVRGLKALAKDAYCLKPKDVLKKWMSQVKGGGLATYGSVPIYSAYYESLPGVEAKKRDLLFGTGMYYLSDGMASGRVVTDENRIQFWKTFGITPWEQKVIEEKYRSLEYEERDRREELPQLVLPLPVI